MGGEMNKDRPIANRHERAGLTLADYAKAKRLPEEFLKKMGLTDLRMSGKPAVKIPYMDASGAEVAARYRLSMDSSEARFKWRSGDKPIPYGLWRTDDARKSGQLSIVEGESDAQTLWLSDFPAIGLPGATSWKEEWLRYFRGIEKILVHIEPDRGGEALLKKLAKSKIRERVWIVRLKNAKDPSELYLRDPNGFRQSWEDALEQAQPWSAIEDDLNLKLQLTEPADVRGYEATSSGLVWHKQTDRGDEDVQLTNFTARITADISEDDGVECHRRFEIESSVRNETSRFDVPAGQFPTMNWVAEKVGARAVILPPFINRDHARAAIQLLSGDVPERKVYAHLGWRHLPEGWAYLHAGGAITADGLNKDIVVRLPEVLKDFKLPKPPKKEELVTAVRASLSILDVATHEITVPLFAAIWRPPLGKNDLTLHLAGPTGAGKTEAAALGQQHYGRRLGSRNLPAGWTGTANSLEVIAFAAKDALLVVDDFAPQGNMYEVARSHREADRLIRAQGNSAGRSRLKSDATLRPTKSPRGLIASTGEDIPRGHSTRARMFVIELGPRSLDWNKLSRLQKLARKGIFSQTMAAYLQWLAPQYDEIQRLFRSKVVKFRAEASRSTAHRRTPDAVAHLAAALLVFLKFAKSCGAVTEQQKETLWQQIWDALGAAAEQQREYQRSEEPTSRFMELLNSALSTNSVHLADARDGWKADGAGGNLIGWFDDEAVYLEPDSAFAAVQQLAHKQGDGLSVTSKTLWKRMKERGYLARSDGDRNLYAVTIAEQRRRVLAVKAAKLHVDPELLQHRRRLYYPET